MGATASAFPCWLRWDYIGRRKIWFEISATVVGLSLLTIAINGLNPGIDFRGGT